MPDRQLYQNHIDFIQRKLNFPAAFWEDFTGSVNAKGFTVAGALKADLLDDLHQIVTGAIADGQSITEFRKGFDDVVNSHGWPYRGKRGWRTRVIYDTNMRTAHAAGAWNAIQRDKDNRGYLQYLTVGDDRVRPKHDEWDEMVLPVDDPFWQSHYPPNGWGCRCTVRTLSADDMEREGLKVSGSPDVKRRDVVQPKSGVVFADVPEGIDAGWDYNVGQAWLGPDIALGKKIAEMRSPRLRNIVYQDIRRWLPAVQTSYQAWRNEHLKDKKPKGAFHTLGYLPAGVLDYLKREGVDPNTAVIIGKDTDLIHGIRDAKKNPISEQLLDNLVEELGKPLAIYYDLQARKKGKHELVFVLPSEQRNMVSKVIVRVDHKAKLTAADRRYKAEGFNGFVTATEVPERSISSNPGSFERIR